MSFLSLVSALLLSTSTWAALPQAGVYTLVTGTDGCAERVEWVNECDGFVLNPVHDGAKLNPEKFCKVNKGKSSQLVSANQKVVTQVSHIEHQIQKKETQVFFAKNESLELSSEDSIMIDTKGSFLWDHSKNNRGTSCIYKK